jgi:hypothetical protein
MAKASRSRKTKSRPVEAPNPLLERLKEVASAIGLDVREERLHREAGYTVRSGLCRIGEQSLVLLDRNAATDERIEVLCTVLADRDLDAVFIEPDLRRRIGGRALAADGEVPAEAG